MSAARSASLCALWLFVACNDGKETGDDGGPDTSDPGGPQTFTFKQNVSADVYEAAVSPDAIAAHQVSSMLLASAALVAADDKVQDRLNTDGGGDALPSFRGALDCWTRPDYPMFSFSIDYTPCLSTYQMSGGVFVNDHPSGPLLFEFGAFTIVDREIGGVLALDTTDAFAEPLYWTAYNTEGDDPEPENDVKIGVKLDDVLYGVSYWGGASVDFINQEWSMWGVATIGPEEAPIEVIHGGETAEDVGPADPPGANVLKSSLNWLECRCPQSGITSLPMPLLFSSVRIDIDDLEDVPDVIDDPEMDIEVDFELSGQGVLTHTGCGSYDVNYQTQTVEIPISKDQLTGAISFQCATLAINDEQRCEALLAAANNLSGDLLVEVSQEAATTTALAAVEQDFDTSWCQVQ
jgi:hypothetical protein